MAGDCGHTVTKLVYVKCANCLSDIRWTCTVICHTVLWQGYYISTHVVSLEVLGNAVHIWINTERYITEA